ncbi:MAG: GNAT family N-acetyltransferase [Candidatus Bathyarchaeota archaeon]|nr:GNAT family N-acetyltransferase [Candidatus Bathyarchaeota archaeon]MDH5787574.1 GNAT family N-acetyltransferase [Candidatus Bathyarchaeota archaeon]
MEHFAIRQFKEKDINFAHEMNATEHWGDTKSDIERMFNYEPKGCFIAEARNKPAGHIFSISYGRVGWIGFLIVEAEYRRKGIGTLLMKKAINYLLNLGVETIKLEAVPAIAGLYRKLGFVDEYGSLRLSGKKRKNTAESNPSATFLKKENMKEVVRFDAEYFGADRTKVLTSLYRDNPRLCFGSHVGSKIAGYVMCRGLQDGYRIGPWVCSPENPEAAKELLTKCIDVFEHDARLYVGVPAVNEGAVEILREFGFVQYSESIRMRFGKKLENDCVNGIFAIGGPEKG